MVYHSTGNTMKINELLNEVFNKPGAYEITKSSENLFKAKFLVKDNNYEVTAENHDDEGWLFEFTLDGEAELTGTGNEFEVFATVKEVFTVFIKKMKPEKFTFGASEDEPSRVKLYKRMAKQIASKFNYDLSERREGSEFMFEFSK